MNYKLVVCDMDGTLLTSNHRISDYTADIIKKIEDNGIKFMNGKGTNIFLNLCQDTIEIV